MNLLLTQILNGLVIGMVLFLLSAGLTLIFGLLGVINLVHGSFFMLGGFFALSVVEWTGNFWLAVLVAPFPVALIALLIESVFLRRLYARSKLDQVLLTFGLSFVITDLTEWVWGKGLFGINEPEGLDRSVRLFGSVFPQYRLAVLAFAAVCAVVMWLMIERTRAGAMVRAGVDNAEAAMGIGLNVPVLLSTTFALGGAIAGLAGAIAAPLLGVYSGLDVEVLIPAFIIVAIGGLGSLKGSLIGSLVIGMADTFGKAYLPGLSVFLVYLTMIAILSLRPNGLFGLDPAEA